MATKLLKCEEGCAKTDVKIILSICVRFLNLIYAVQSNQTLVFEH
jgi:hypothetical protein